MTMCQSLSFADLILSVEYTLEYICLNQLSTGNGFIVLFVTTKRNTPNHIHNQFDGLSILKRFIFYVQCVWQGYYLNVLPLHFVVFFMVIFYFFIRSSCGVMGHQSTAPSSV